MTHRATTHTLALRSSALVALMLLLACDAPEFVSSNATAALSRGAQPRTLQVSQTPIAIAAGHAHSCALQLDGAIFCWGDNKHGQLGLDHTETIGDDEQPRDSGPALVDLDAVALTAGGRHTCALKESGSIRCFGDNESGQLGQGHNEAISAREAPYQIDEIVLPQRAVALAAGEAHTCALSDLGQVFCFGDNTFGQLGLGHTENIGDNEPAYTVDPVALDEFAVALAAGGNHTCVLLESGAVRCFGDNTFGQLGLGHTDNIGDDEEPIAVSPASLGEPASDITVGDGFTCAVLKSGALNCFGKNSSGQLGLGHTDNIGDDELPKRVGLVPLDEAVRFAVAGAHHTCVQMDSTKARCFGENHFGQLGVGDTNPIGARDSALPERAVPLGRDIRAMALGGSHTCMINGAKRVICFGRNDSGQLGLAHTETIGDDEIPTSSDIAL